MVPDSSATAVYQTGPTLSRSGYKRDHLVEILSRAGLFVEQPARVQQVVAGLVDDGRVVGQVLVLVAGHDGAGLQRRDLVERGQPRLDSAVGAFEQVLMHAVVGDVACDDQSDGGDVQHRGVVGVGVADLDGEQSVALQLDPVDGNGSIVHGAGRYLAGEVDVPQLGAAHGALLMHHRDRAVGRVRDRVGKPLQQKVGAEPVIAVSMGGVDGGQVLAGALDPVADAVAPARR